MNEWMNECLQHRLLTDNRVVPVKTELKAIIPFRDHLSAVVIACRRSTAEGAPGLERRLRVSVISQVSNSCCPWNTPARPFVIITRASALSDAPAMMHRPPRLQETLLQLAAGIGRVSYIRIYLCYFCFRWKTISLVQASLQYLMHHVTVSLQQSKITLQKIGINNTSITQPTLSFYLWLTM